VAPELKTGLLKAFVPANLKVPLEMLKKPAVFADCTWNVPPGIKLKVDVAGVPLFNVTPVVWRKFVSVALLQSKEEFDAPLKMISAPDMPVPLAALKFIVPLLTRFPPTMRELFFIALFELAGALKKVPLEAIVTLPVTMTVRGPASSYCNTPEAPCPIVTEPNEGVFKLIVTVAPSVITTSSPIPGATPPTQVDGELHNPPVDVELIVTAKTDELNRRKKKANTTLLLTHSTLLTRKSALPARHKFLKLSSINLCANSFNTNKSFSKSGDLPGRNRIIWKE
jgi:hypothetical protein